MALSSLLSRSVTVVRRTASEDFDIAYSEASYQTVCEIQQRTRAEVEGAIAVTDWLLILPPNTGIDANDIVIVEGERYEVVSSPWRVRNPRTGIEHHVEATLRYTGNEEAA